MSLFNTSTGKSVKFANIGDTITGSVKQLPFERQQTKFGSQDPDFWPNGDPKMAVVVPLQTSLREDGDDDGERTLWVTSTSMKKAIGTAIQTARVPDVAVDGQLTVTFIGFDPASKNPQNPKKLYTAAYTPPVSGVAPAAPVQAVAPQQAPAPAPAPQAAPIPAAPAPAPVADTFGLPAQQVAQIGTMRAAGITDEQIGTALGLSPAQLQSIPF